MDAALRFRQTSSSVATTANSNNDWTLALAVVHATADPIFCPHPDRWQRLAPGIDDDGSDDSIQFHMLRDDHVFMRTSSERALKDVLAALLQRRRAIVLSGF